MILICILVWNILFMSLAILTCFGVFEWSWWLFTIPLWGNFIVGVLIIYCVLFRG